MTLLADKLRALFAGATALAAEIEAFELLVKPAPPPVPSPPPAPEPPPAPIPAPPDDPVRPVSIVVQPLNVGNLVVFRDYVEGSPYERFQRLTVWAGNSATVRIKGWSLAGGGVPRTFSSARYELLVDGAVVSAVDVPPGSNKAEISVPLAGLSHGWHWLDLRGTAGEGTPTWPVFVDKGGAAPSLMPVVQGTYSIVNHKRNAQVSAMVPAVFAPAAVPLEAREYPHAPTLLTREQMVRRELVPRRLGDIYRTRTNGKITHTFGYQSYFFDTLTGRYPNIALLDGPRGVGCVGMPTHLEVGTAAPPSTGFIGNVYFCDPWRVGKIRSNGTVITMVGWRHKAPHQNSGKPLDDLELVGDWSAIPEDRRGFWEIWGLAWDRRRDGGNNVGEPSPDPRERGLIPHPVGMGAVIFLADSQHNRIVRCEFPHDTHFAYERTKVTEFITGLADPWDCVCEAGVLYVSERKAHRIAAYDATTGAYIRTVVEGAALSALDQNRVAKLLPGSTLAMVREQPCQLPEGLFLQDGWLYWGALIQQQVRRVNLTTGAVEVVQDVPYSSVNSKFIKIALSDGTFHPRGHVFACTWAVYAYGMPLGLNVGFNSAGYGPGKPWETLSYPTACGVGNGRLVCGSATEGVSIISRALPTDAVIKEPQWKAMSAAWGDYELIHGQGGYGFYGLPLPWGESALIDAYLVAQGHTKG